MHEKMAETDADYRIYTLNLSKPRLLDSFGVFFPHFFLIQSNLSRVTGFSQPGSTGGFRGQSRQAICVVYIPLSQFNIFNWFLSTITLAGCCRGLEGSTALRQEVPFTQSNFYNHYNNKFQTKTPSFLFSLGRTQHCVFVFWNQFP